MADRIGKIDKIDEIDKRTKPVHGGDIFTASHYYPIAPDKWLDLSTGINPVAYPYSDIPMQAMTRLPYLSPEFLNAAKGYFQAESVLAVPGSQRAIQLLPRCLPLGGVLVPDIGYQEHSFYWHQAGARLATYRAMDESAACSDIDDALSRQTDIRHLVVINPNNPTGLYLNPDNLLHWAAQLHDRSGYLIVDEAFIDATPQQSVLTNRLPTNVVVLRSFGKFFGLAGLRLGFVISNDKLLRRLADELGEWSVNGVAQAIATQALRDTPWQQQMAKTLLANRANLEQLFSPLIQHPDIVDARVMPLFLSLVTTSAMAQGLYHGFAQAGVLIRVIRCSDSQSILRIGCANLDDPNVVAKLTEIILALATS